MKPSVKILKQEAFARVEECRKKLKSGEVNLAGLEQVVKAYCQAVEALATDEGQQHTQDLEELMSEVSALSDELLQSRESVAKELSKLGRVKQANVAYQKTDAIGPVYRPKEEEE